MDGLVSQSSTIQFVGPHGLNLVSTFTFSASLSNLSFFFPTSVRCLFKFVGHYLTTLYFSLFYFFLFSYFHFANVVSLSFPIVADTYISFRQLLAPLSNRELLHPKIVCTGIFKTFVSMDHLYQKHLEHSYLKDRYINLFESRAWWALQYFPSCHLLLLLSIVLH